MTRLPDYSRWLTPTRLEVEERYWKDPQLATWPTFLAFIVKLASAKPMGSIVEFGCGTGLIAPHLPAKVRYIGVDDNFLCVSNARGRNRDRKESFVLGDVRTVVLLERTFDLACAFSFMKHFSSVEWPAVLKRVLSYGERGLFSMRIGETIVDDGVEFPHLQVTPLYCSQAVVDAGHQIVNTERLPWGEVMVETCRI